MPMVCRFLHQSFYEWARRKTNDTTIALFVKRNNNKNDSKTSNRILQILQLIAINTRHMVTPAMIVSGANGWRIRKRMHGWRSIQIRPTVPLQLPTLQATKAITQ